jgi:hypothetical protein
MTSDTFHYLPVGMLPNPGTCCVCGSNQRGCVDFGITVEYFGAVLICEECILDISNVEQLGLITRSEVAQMMEQNELLLAREERVQRERYQLRDAVVAVVDSFNRAVDDSEPSNLVSIPIAPAHRVNFLEVFRDPN